MSFLIQTIFSMIHVVFIFSKKIFIFYFISYTVVFLLYLLHPVETPNFGDWSLDVRIKNLNLFENQIKNHELFQPIQNGVCTRSDSGNYWENLLCLVIKKDNNDYNFQSYVLRYKNNFPICMTIKNSNEIKYWLSYPFCMSYRMIHYYTNKNDFVLSKNRRDLYDKYYLYNEKFIKDDRLNIDYTMNSFNLDRKEILELLNIIKKSIKEENIFQNKKYKIQSLNIKYKHSYDLVFELSGKHSRRFVFNKKQTKLLVNLIENNLES
tara:strand:+ start:434 stop:1228 length:795 start_codon:yes stop_codon:yes gene_type:complete